MTDMIFDVLMNNGAIGLLQVSFINLMNIGNYNWKHRKNYTTNLKRLLTIETEERKEQKFEKKETSKIQI